MSDIEEATANPGGARNTKKDSSDAGFVRNDTTPAGTLECTVCGALVGDAELHRKSHR